MTCLQLYKNNVYYFTILCSIAVLFTRLASRPEPKALSPRMATDGPCGKEASPCTAAETEQHCLDDEWLVLSPCPAHGLKNAAMAGASSSMPSPVLGIPVRTVVETREFPGAKNTLPNTPTSRPEMVQVPHTFDDLSQISSKLLSAATTAMIARGVSPSFGDGPAAPPAVACTKVLHTAVPHLSARALLPLCTIRVCIV